ncbi:Homeobox protein Nkx-6.3 [Entomophthora muscae]|uniref:Homeobox protein Nkx-6.3 n=1 Tax=Entomophthora muscae TaxID=34485 RepID=A0ACC2TBY7_9FUNG|nr:Homeobox protein Nkx-6.3 [Entomophthora muscae]
MAKIKCAGFPIHRNSAGHAIDLIIRKPYHKKRNRHEPHQVYVLQRYFEKSVFLDERELDDIKYLTGLSEAQIKVWFNNARSRLKRKSLSSDGYQVY